MSGNRRAHLRVPQVLQLWCIGYYPLTDHFIKSRREGDPGAAAGVRAAQVLEKCKPLSDSDPRRAAHPDRGRRCPAEVDAAPAHEGSAVVNANRAGGPGSQLALCRVRPP